MCYNSSITINKQIEMKGIKMDTRLVEYQLEKKYNTTTGWLTISEIKDIYDLDEDMNTDQVLEWLSAQWYWIGG